MYSIVQFCTSLVCFVPLKFYYDPFCTNLYCFVQFCTVLYRFVPFCIVLYSFVPLCTVLYQLVPINIAKYSLVLWSPNIPWICLMCTYAIVFLWIAHKSNILQDQAWHLSCITLKIGFIFRPIKPSIMSSVVSLQCRKSITITIRENVGHGILFGSKMWKLVNHYFASFITTADIP